MGDLTVPQNVSMAVVRGIPMTSGDMIDKSVGLVLGFDRGDIGEKSRFLDMDLRFSALFDGEITIRQVHE